MFRKLRSGLLRLALATATALAASGCTGVHQYLQNRLKVGPEYCPPAADVAEHWLDEADVRVRAQADDLSHWWTVFSDPALDSLINTAYQQNLSLREAGFRVLQARAQLGAAEGYLFPQKQTATASYTHQLTARLNPFSLFEIPQTTVDTWSYGFNLAWELDFWGRFRRAIEAADNRLSSSVESYDDVLVTLLSDIATNYVQMRVLQDEIKAARDSAKWQQEILEYFQARAGQLQTGLDAFQAEAVLMQTEAQIPLFEVALRQATNRLCILLGMPPTELESRVGPGQIPAAPPEVAVGIPAELLSRRPDVRRAEREAAAQAQQIGIAMADLYPSLAISGTIGYQANQFRDLLAATALTGTTGPSFQWNILNYNRIRNNVRFQDARFQELVVHYQTTVLQANEEAENSLVSFLRAQDRVKLLERNVNALREARKILKNAEEAGERNIDGAGDPRLRGFVIEQDLVRQQDQLAQAKGQIAIALIRVYKALGGGWQIRLDEAVDVAATTLPAVPLPVDDAPALPAENP